MDDPNASQRPDALPRRQVDLAQPEESRLVPAALSEASPPGLVERPSMELLARVRDGLAGLDQPAPAAWQEVWGS